MMARTTGVARAKRYLDAYAQVMADHEAAMRCFDLEELLAEATDTLRVIRWADELSRDVVGQGLVTNLDALSGAMWGLYDRWLRLTRAVHVDLKSAEATFGKVRGAAEFRAAIGDAERILRDWVPLRASRTRAMLDYDWSDEDAEAAGSLPPARSDLVQSILGDHHRPIPGDPSLVR